MYPSLVEASSRGAGALAQASRAALGVAPEMFYQTNAFDQGYLNHIGIEACTERPAKKNMRIPTSTWPRSIAPAMPPRSMPR